MIFLRTDPFILPGLVEGYTDRVTVIGTFPGGIGDSPFNINQGAFDANNAGPDEPSFLDHLFGDRPRVVPPITPLALPDEDSWQVEIPADIGSLGSGLAGAQPTGGTGASGIDTTLTVASFGAGGVEQAHGGSGYYLGTNGRFSPNTWQGNGANGGRISALKVGASFRGVGYTLFAAQLIRSINILSNHPTGEEWVHQGFNTGFAVWGLRGGAPGFAAATLYSLVDSTIGWGVLLDPGDPFAPVYVRGSDIHAPLRMMREKR